MKKLICIVLAALMILTCAAALADEEPQPEGGRKFEGRWALRGGLVEVYYEEEGYRVMVDLYDQTNCTGTQWEYSCFYSEEPDALLSVSSAKSGYTMNPDTLEITRGEPEYQGMDGENETTVFTLSENGALHWNDGRGNSGADIEFRNIGWFEGVWRNDAEGIYTEFQWQGLLDENEYCYYVFVAHGNEDYPMLGAYSEETGKLSCYSTDVCEKEEDLFAALDAGKPCDAVFSYLEDGGLLMEMNGSFELEYDILGPES